MNTWLCTFQVMVDLPTTMTPGEMENAVAQALAAALPYQGLAGNCMVTLVATAGNVNVLDVDGTGTLLADTPNSIGVLTPIDQGLEDTAVATPDILVPETSPQAIPTNPIGAV